MFLLTYFNKAEKNKEGRGKRFSAFVIFACVLSVALFAVWAVHRVNTVPAKAYCETLGEYSLKASTDIERESFFSQFGFTAESVSHSLVVIPSKGKVFEEYNALQRTQGLDLRPFMGKNANQYVLRLEKAGQDTPLYGVLITYKDSVVALHLTDFAPGTQYIGLCEV